MAKRSSDTVMRRYRLYLVANGMLYWWGSYERRGNAMLYLKQSGSVGMRCMIDTGDADATKWQYTVMLNGEIREATPIEAQLLSWLPQRNY